MNKPIKWIFTKEFTNWTRRKSNRSLSGYIERRDMKPKVLKQKKETTYRALSLKYLIKATNVKIKSTIYNIPTQLIFSHTKTKHWYIKCRLRAYLKNISKKMIRSNSPNFNQKSLTINSRIRLSYMIEWKMKRYFMNKNKIKQKMIILLSQPEMSCIIPWY